MSLPETDTETTPAIIAAAVTGKAKKTPAATTANPRTNPYKRGNYAKLFDWMMSHKGKPFLVSAMLEFAKTLTDKHGSPLTEPAIRATLAVILGPRKESKRGDCRGNASAEGHVYFVQPVAVDFKDMPEGTSKRDWKKAQRKMILRWREPMLEPLYRKDADGKPMTPKRKAKATAEKATPAAKSKGNTGKAKAKATTGKGKAKGKAEPTAEPAAKSTTPKTEKSGKRKGKAEPAKTSWTANQDGYKAENDAEPAATPPSAETPVDAPAEPATA